MNYFLPFARLAPVQCTGWGSTITSGVPAVDHFLSSELVETPDSGDQYTESLWRSRTLFVNASRFPAVAPVPPSHFGLPEGHHLYVCLQNPLKLHPDVDGLFAAILAADAKGLILLAGHGRAMQSTCCGSGSPGGFRPLRNGSCSCRWQTIEDYYRLLQLADVILDPPHYGAGSSCYDLFSFNLPVVTMPGELIVGRITQACYRKMGVEDLIVHSAEEYVSKAVQVATDRDYRKYVTERIAQASDVLFNDLEAVREHERFFEEGLAGNDGT